MNILLVTDAWLPQVNGVVTTLGRTCRTAEAMGHELRVISPSLFRTVPCPTYPSIRLALRPGPRLARELAAFDRRQCTCRPRARWAWPAGPGA